MLHIYDPERRLTQQCHIIVGNSAHLSTRAEKDDSVNRLKCTQSPEPDAAVVVFRTYMTNTCPPTLHTAQRDAGSTNQGEHVLSELRKTKRSGVDSDIVDTQSCYV